MYRIILLLTALALVFVSCSDDQTSEDKQTSEMVEQNDKYSDSTFSMVYDFPKGTKLKYRLTSVANTHQTIQSDTTVITDVNQTVIYVFAVESLGSEGGNFKLNVSVDSLRMRATFGDEVLEFDSAKEMDQKTKQKFAEYASLPNTNYTVIVSPEGTIQEVGDIDGIVKNFLEIQNANAIPSDRREELKQQMREGAIRPLSQQLFKHMPSHKVGIDSTWDYTYDSGMGVFDFENTATSKIISIKEAGQEKIADIEVDLSVKIEGDGNVTQNGMEYKFEQPNVTGEGNTLFNIDKGHLVRNETSTKIEMIVYVTGNDPNRGPVDVSREDVSVNRNTIELIESK